VTNFLPSSTLSSHANACPLADRKYGWVPIDLPLHVTQSLKRSKRWSILPAFSIDGYIAWEVHHDFITKEIFLDFMRSQVLPICNSEGVESRSVMIMNNARIHQSAELDELCESFGMHLAKLPPYSPDYNLIESSFSVLKAWIKRNDQLVRWYDESNGGFGEFLRVAVRSQRERVGDSEALFRLAGIVHISRWYLDIDRLIVVKLIMLLRYLWIII